MNLLSFTSHAYAEKKPRWLYCSKTVAIILMVASLGLGCISRSEQKPLESIPGKSVYENLATLLLNKDFNKALQAIESGLRTSEISPSAILSDSLLRILIEDPAYRPPMRELIKKYATSNIGTMVCSSEPGQSIIVLGKIIDASSLLPLNEVMVELVHADHEGDYFKEKSSWNPRLFIYLVTDQKGQFEITTIRPGRYYGDDGRLEKSHIHFNIEKEGYRSYSSEFIIPDGLKSLNTDPGEDVLIATKVNTDDIPHYQIEIALEQDR